MRIRNPHRSPPFVFTCSDAPPVAAVKASFPDALISNTLRMKSFTEPVNPTSPVALKYRHQYIESQQSNLSSSANMAGVTKTNGNADDVSDSSELKQTQSFPAIPNKEEEEIEKLRVCTVNKSPWDVPSFVRAFLTKPTTEPAAQSMQTNSSRRNYRKRTRGPLIPNLASHTKAMAEANQQVHAEDDDDFNKTAIASYEGGLTLPCEKEEIQMAEEEQVLESALVRVFSEEVAGLTVREAGCKLMLRNANTIISEGLPLSVQVRRAMLNSPYFVQMDDGKFTLWDDFLNTAVGRLDEEEITSSQREEKMGIRTFDREEDCATYMEPAKGLGQLAETNPELAVPKIMRTQGKRSRRAGLALALVMDMRVQDEEKEEKGICKQSDGKRRNSFRQAIEQISYNSVCGIRLRINQALPSGNNSSSIDGNNRCWDKDAVAASGSQCCYRQSISDRNNKPHQNGVLRHGERDRAASCLVPFISGNIGKNELRPPYYRKRKPVKARSLNGLL